MPPELNNMISQQLQCHILCFVCMLLSSKVQSNALKDASDHYYAITTSSSPRALLPGTASLLVGWNKLRPRQKIKIMKIVFRVIAIAVLNCEVVDDNHAYFWGFTENCYRFQTAITDLKTELGPVWSFDSLCMPLLKLAPQTQGYPKAYQNSSYLDLDIVYTGDNNVVP